MKQVPRGENSFAVLVVFAGVSAPTSQHEAAAPGRESHRLQRDGHVRALAEYISEEQWRQV